MFSRKSFAIIYGLQLGAAQNMLDFDFLVDRPPSVKAFINPGKKISNHKLFYGDGEILITSYPSFESVPRDILNSADTMLNFASHRSAYNATLETLEYSNFENIIIIAEGIAESETRRLIALNDTKYYKNIIGPSTVGAMVRGGFRAGNTGGSLDNIIESRLYQKGSVGIVSKSGGMSNELRRIVADTTDGSHTSIAIGGDKYWLAGFVDIIKSFEDNDDIKMIVMLGEIGGIEELKIADMIKSGEIKKPVVAWCIGTIGDHLDSSVQFGHAGAKSDKKETTAIYKNQYLKNSGAIVPESFMDFGDKIKKTFEKVGGSKSSLEGWSGSLGGQIDDEILEKLSKIKSRKMTPFTSSISDERGDELHYNHKSISSYVNSSSIANVIGNLWLKRDLPDYGLEFINTLIILLADHGPRVSGAHNTIITSRAGNSLKDSLIAGLTTIGPRFGGAIDGAGRCFFEAVSNNTLPDQFVRDMKLKGVNIPGIGHRIKSKFNPDKRCEILLEVSKKFPSTRYLDFALQVAEITLSKKPNLILNVDGMTAGMLLDMFEDIGLSDMEIKKYIDAGIFNGFFILSRTIGFIGHHIDQQILGEGLYRAPWDDILYL